MKFKKLLPIIGIIILLLIISSLDLQKIINIFSKINPIYSIMSFFVVIPLILLANIGWQLLLEKQRIKVSFWYSIKNFFIGYFYGFITPGAFGAYTRSLYLSEESRVPLLKCVSNLIIFNTIEFISLLFVGAIGAIYLSSIYPSLFFIIILVIIIVISLFLIFYKDKKSKALFVKIVKFRLFATIKDKLENSIESFYEDLPKFKDVILPFVISVSGWVLKYILMFFIAKLFFINIPFLYFIMIMAVTGVISSLPISIYGLGTREAALISMLNFWNIPRENVVSFSLFWFVIIWIAPSVFGSFITFFETKKFEKYVLTDKLANNFNRYMKRYPELYRYTTEIVKRNIPKKIDKPVIIDLGAGTGLLSSEILNQIPTSQIFAIDPSEKMLDLANKNVKKEGFHTMIGASDDIPLENNFADIIVSRLNLTYWDKPADSLNEVFRVLKPGGKIIIEAINKDFPKHKLFLIKIRLYLKSAGVDIIRYHMDSYKTAYRFHQIEMLLKKTGYKLTYKDYNKDYWKYIIVGKK
jgi:uncharacterized protein (TIRG00374 family)